MRNLGRILGVDYYELTTLEWEELSLLEELAGDPHSIESERTRRVLVAPDRARDCLVARFEPAIPPRPEAPWEVIPTELWPVRVVELAGGARRRVPVAPRALLTYCRGTLVRIVTDDAVVDVSEGGVRVQTFETAAARYSWRPK